MIPSDVLDKVEAAGLRVKPLEWNHDRYASDPWGGYYINDTMDDMFSWAHSSRGDADCSEETWPTVSKAKAAAQADYERRVLAALQAARKEEG